MLAAGCSLMLKGSVKAMCSSGRAGSLVGLGQFGGDRPAIGAVGESTKSKGAQAATAASRIAPIWL